MSTTYVSCNYDLHISLIVKPWERIPNTYDAIHAIAKTHVVGSLRSLSKALIPSNNKQYVGRCEWSFLHRRLTPVKPVNQNPRHIYTLWPIYAILAQVVCRHQAINLTNWGRGTHICVSKLTVIGSGNELSPGRHLAIIWTNAGILLIRP